VKQVTWCFGYGSAIHAMFLARDREGV